MKAILMSIHPQWVEKILNGEKTIEIRKTKPKLETPFKVYIYCTRPESIHRDCCVSCGKEYLYKDNTEKIAISTKNNITTTNYQILNSKIVGEFICTNIKKYNEHLSYMGLYYTLNSDINEELDMDNWEIAEYAQHKPIYLWHISDLKIYDEPKEIYEFEKPKCDWKCNECKYCVSYSYYEPPDCLKEFCINRPPRSWQYVEELKE